MSNPNFRRGADAAKEAASKSSGSSFARTHFFGIKDGERAVVRFLTDATDWLVVAQHSMVTTRPAPADFKGNWPQANTAVCRRDVAFSGMYSDCYVCDHVQGKGGKPSKPVQRQWALAVLREEVTDGGRVVGYRDQVRKVAEMRDGQPTGVEVEEKAVVVINMAYNNFFSALDGYAGIYGTVLDRDYLIKRTGGGLDTTYQIVPIDPITLSDGRRFDLREPDLMARYEPLPDLGAIVTERSSDEYFARFFDVRLPQPASTEGRSNPAAQSVPTATVVSNDVDADALAALAARVKGYTDPAATAPAAGLVSYD